MAFDKKREGITIILGIKVDFWQCWIYKFVPCSRMTDWPLDLDACRFSKENE